MIGADESRYLAISQLASRLVTFPDGVSRHLTLSRWHWEALDRLQSERGWTPYDAPETALEHAETFCSRRQPAAFEAQLRRSFRLMIEAGMVDLTPAGGREVANQPLRAWSERPPIQLVQLFTRAADGRDQPPGP